MLKYGKTSLFGKFDAVFMLFFGESSAFAKEKKRYGRLVVEKIVKSS